MKFSRFVPVVLALTITPCVPHVQADERDDKLALELAGVVHDRLAKPFARADAARSLGKMGTRAGAAVPELVAQLSRLRPDQDEIVLSAVIQALGEIGYPARSAMAPLAKLASASDIELARAARKASDQILLSLEDADTVALIKLLRDRNAGQRVRAAKSLGLLGNAAKVAIPDLVGSLRDIDGDVRRAALNTLKVLGYTPKETELADMYALDLLEPDEYVRLKAARALGKLGPKAISALPALQAALDDPDLEVRRAVVDAIQRISP
jgi:HEAT repeat protein